MKIRLRFILFIIIIHAAAVVVSYYFFRENKLLFLAFEVVVLISLALSISLYRALIRPLQLLMRGIDAIRDRDFNVRFQKTGSTEMDQLVAVYNTMMDQLRTERVRQQEQHFFLEKLIQTSPTGILILDYDNNISAVNPRAANLLGISEADLKNKSLSDFNHPFLKVSAELSSGASRTISVSNARTFKIQKAHFIDRGFQRAFVMIEELTGEILEAEKKAYGKVIRMMAHEVNNSVGAVNSILDTAIQLHTGDAALGNALKVALERNEHLNHFMRRFANVIRLPEPRFEQIDLNDTLRKTATLFEYRAKELGARIEFELASPGPVARADAAQLEQVLINILKNALEALENEGLIRIITESAPPRLRIEDNGRGIDPETESMLFTPFYTNKNGGQGIGLTLIREILTQHHFRFSLRTDRERGVTVFEVEW